MVTAVAQARPRARGVQHMAGEYAYRIAQWSDAVKYFQRGGPIGDEAPLRQFYYAVALFESGDRAKAVSSAKRWRAPPWHGFVGTGWKLATHGFRRSGTLQRQD